MKVLRNCCFFSVIIGLFCLTYSQESKLKALYIINFAKYTIWPPSAAQGNIRIAILGDDPVFEELKAISAGTTVDGRGIEVFQSQSLDKVDKCTILFISPEKSNSLGTALAKYSSLNTLIVTSKEGFGKFGAGINIIVSNGKLSFEINVDALKKSGLTAKPALFKLGKTI